MATIRWNLAVSEETDRAVRDYLASNKTISNEGLSEFIESAVCSYLFEQEVEKAKAATAGMDEQQINSLIDEAIDWVRSN